MVNKQNANKVFQELSNKKNFITGKFVDPKVDILGYSGYNVKVRASNGHIAEIQINTPSMIYAKEPAESAIAQLGQGLYNKLNKRYNGIGGKGHIFYDKHNIAVKNKNYKLALEIKSKSINYYKQFINN